MSFEKLLLQKRKALYAKVRMPNAEAVRKSVEESNKRDIARATLFNAPKPDKIFIDPLPRGILLNGEPEYRFLNLDGYSLSEKPIDQQFALLEQSGFDRPLNYESMSAQDIQSYLLVKIQQVNQIFPVVKNITQWLTLENSERNKVLDLIGNKKKLDAFKLKNLASSIGKNLELHARAMMASNEQLFSDQNEILTQIRDSDFTPAPFQEVDEIKAAEVRQPLFKRYLDKNEIFIPTNSDGSQVRCEACSDYYNDNKTMKKGSIASHLKSQRHLVAVKDRMSVLENRLGNLISPVKGTFDGTNPSSLISLEERLLKLKFDDRSTPQEREEARLKLNLDEYKQKAFEDEVNSMFFPDL